MSSSNSHGSNATITLKSFAQLADVLDLDSLPSGPGDSDLPSAATIDEQPAIAAEPISLDEARTSMPAPADLATLIAQQWHDQAATSRSGGRACSQRDG